eukprot:TRINITY_DN4475_c0_g1_i1.p1 TRINITY_DN4475_c0_g1~~TRINITY_DN4475_c0_g1_i1.p1  ORF type:complete len:325 (+),score=27.96 TRINITY_DN4475_c0_g1_i1:66-977(+)
MSTETMRSFEVNMLSDTKSIQVPQIGTLGDLRLGVQHEFGIPVFEQKLMYSKGEDFVVVAGNDTLPIKTSVPDGVIELLLSRQVDPRFKMEKETAFLEALASCRFEEAKTILESSGVTIDPCCIRRGRPACNVAVSESPYRYAHPALTVAMMAGIEHAVQCLRCDPNKINAWMASEKEVCEVVALLIERGADVNAVGDEDQDCESAGIVTVHGKTPLCAAVQRGSPTLVRMLLEAKADPNHEMKYDQSAWGPDRNNPLGPGVLRPESWLGEISNGSVGTRNASDPRTKYADQISKLLRDAQKS